MEIIPISEAKDRLTELANRAAREHDRFILTRNGRPHAVIVSVAEWKSLQETRADPAAVPFRPLDPGRHGMHPQGGDSRPLEVQSHAIPR
ncbi:type II toxin-antitoxin system Phd/YefM family antitoxin [Streptosporangium carneum]